MDHMARKFTQLSVSKIILSFILILEFLVTCAIVEVEGQNGTTIGIKDIFSTRCNTFIQEHQLNKNCTKLWTLFLKAFAEQPPCAVTTDSYNDFFAEANHTTNFVDKSMFWAFTSPFVYNFTASPSQKGNYVTIQDLLSGYTLNDLKWCWSMDKRDLDYVSCPSYKECSDEHEAVKSFWKANSKIFASLSSGKVFAMLNGSVSGGAYTNRSLFYTVEVPAMIYPRIQEMHVILVHNPEITYDESCSNSTLKILSATLSSKNIKYSCAEDPPDVRNLQCQLHPEYNRTGYCSTSGERSIHHNTLSIKAMNLGVIGLMLIVVSFSISFDSIAI